LEPLLQRRNNAGFRINNFAVSDSPFGFGFSPMFTDSRPAVYYPPHTSDETSHKYAFEIPFKAHSTGIATFPAVRFKGEIMKTTANGTLTAQRIFAVSEPLAIRVVPPPKEEQPASFIGSLATRMEAVTALDAQTCREGDPLVLTLELRGDFTSANMRVPDIALARNFAENFRQYGDTETENPSPGTRRYKYKIRPVSSGTIELPALPVSYFDLRDRAYHTVYSAPIPLRVNPAPELANLFGDTSPTLFLPAKTRHVSGLASDDFFNNGRNGTNGNKSISCFPLIPFFSLLKKFVLPPLIFVVSVILLKLWRMRSRIVSAFRRRSTPARALHRIANAKDPAEVFVALSALCHVPTITPDEFENMLPESDRKSELPQLLREVFNASFDPSVKPEKIVVERRSRIAELLAGLKFVFVFLFAFTAQADDFTMKHVTAMTASASAPADFAEAAQVMRPLVEAAPRNAGLLYNYGTLCLLAENNDAALDALLRAEAIAGAVPEIANNLAIAYGDSTPWLRTPLFWHYGVALNTRANVLFAAWCALWIGLFLRRFKLRRTGTMFLVLGIAGTIILASSVIASKRVLDKPLPQMTREGAAK
ncbi:MAG: BatD family protein, partial [Kiritimatiellaeota bacterium]|nr:BatD family protein [Kiritimatiellota bacterium]